VGKTYSGTRSAFFTFPSSLFPRTAGMSEPNLDPALLFTPTKPSSTPSLNDDIQVPSIRQPQTRSSNSFYVSLPSLSLAEKSNYKEASEVALTSDVEFDSEELDEIIGEYHNKGKSFYFVRFQNGIAHKV
jgi:chromodomain-helicase-DNA-binding protein 4